MEKIKVLYIDDEVINLQAFKATFRRQFDIYLAKSADEGTEVLKNNPIEVVIADQRMPNKTGVDFFESILDIHPNPIRILLTAYSDINAIIDAINKGQVYRYVTKPWSEYDLKLTIENAYQLYLLKEQNNKLNLKYKEVFSSSTDPIILFDNKGRIIDYNKATLSLIEDKAESLYFTSFNSILYNKEDAQYLSNLLKDNKTIKDFECQILTKKGTLKTCLISGNSITNNYDEIISHQVIIKDITERSKTAQALLKNTIKTQEKERERIARDMHDGLGQSLVSLKLRLEVLKDSVKEKNLSDLDLISQDISSSIQQLREICHDMIPASLSEFGLKNTLNQICHSIENKDLTVRLTTNNDLDRIEKDTQVTIFRIVQEFLNNSIKHADCSSISININYDKNIKINLSDNGKGFDLKKKYSSLGIQNIISRVKSLNGNVNIHSQKNRGTKVDILIPPSENIIQENLSNQTSFIKNIIAGQFNIGLTTDGVLIAKPEKGFEDSGDIKQAQDYVNALSELNKDLTRPLITFLPDYYITNESIECFNQIESLSANAFVYKNLNQQKMAELLINTENNIPKNIFNNEEEAVEWVKQYIND